MTKSNKKKAKRQFKKIVQMHNTLLFILIKLILNILVNIRYAQIKVHNMADNIIFDNVIPSFSGIICCIHKTTSIKRIQERIKICLLHNEFEKTISCSKIPQHIVLKSIILSTLCDLLMMNYIDFGK